MNIKNYCNREISLRILFSIWTEFLFVLVFKQKRARFVDGTGGVRGTKFEPFSFRILLQGYMFHNFLSSLFLQLISI